MPWQKVITLGRRSKGCHLVTDEILPQISEGLRQTPVGILHLFIQHTSAALTVNENYDPDVRKDMSMALDQIVPESMPWLHTDEGPECVHGPMKRDGDHNCSVSHTKTSLIGPSLHIPITNNRLNLGTWQGMPHTAVELVPQDMRVKGRYPGHSLLLRHDLVVNTESHEPDIIDSDSRGNAPQESPSDVVDTTQLQFLRLFIVFAFIYGPCRVPVPACHHPVFALIIQCKHGQVEDDSNGDNDRSCMRRGRDNSRPAQKIN
ncbi:hypothetical protein AG1IA_08192 [Rhizoctonia solani AG-1 IA]|uniref:Uncharacterized protein n=1 Tax=Thanatephorus cucumeris (strain AG1-IA) TaxID=983506 RepID=L8WHW0_THACA|nr:hypothetical protein AG1IA_08192 [Rhizoctonia solani AG-1 IA]